MFFLVLDILGTSKRIQEGRVEQFIVHIKYGY